jgi:hypothetical protein
MNVWAVYADLERRGFTFRVRGNELSIAPATELTDDDDARITRFLGELIDLVQRYTAGEHGAAFMVSCARAQLEAFTIDGRPRCQRCGGLAPADGCHRCEACRPALNACVWESHDAQPVARPEASVAA